MLTKHLHGQAMNPTQGRKYDPPFHSEKKGPRKKLLIQNSSCYHLRDLELTLRTAWLDIPAKKSA